MHQLLFLVSLVTLVSMLSFLAVSEVDGSASGRSSSVTGNGPGYWLGGERTNNSNSRDP